MIAKCVALFSVLDGVDAMFTTAGRIAVRQAKPNPVARQTRTFFQMPSHRTPATTSEKLGGTAVLSAAGAGTFMQKKSNEIDESAIRGQKKAQVSKLN